MILGHSMRAGMVIILYIIMCICPHLATADTGSTFYAAVDVTLKDGKA